MSSAPSPGPVVPGPQSRVQTILLVVIALLLVPIAWALVQRALQPTHSAAGFDGSWKTPAERAAYEQAVKDQTALARIQAQAPAPPPPPQFGWVPGTPNSFVINVGETRATAVFKDLRLQVTLRAVSPIGVGIVEAENLSLFQTDAQAWQKAQYYCLRQSVLATVLECTLPEHDAGYMMVLHDERNPAMAVIAPAAAFLGAKQPLESLSTQNNITIIAASWGCIKNCQPN